MFNKVGVRAPDRERALLALVMAAGWETQAETLDAAAKRPKTRDV